MGWNSANTIDKRPTVASPKFKTVPKTTELLTLNSQNLYEEEPIYGGSDDQSH